MEGSATAVAANYLEQNTETLVANWLDWVRRRIEPSAIDALPEPDLRSHIPSVLASLAKYVREPKEIVRDELRNNLQLHGRTRRDQAYSLERVLAELEGLADVVTRAVTRALEEATYDDGPAGLLEAANRLAAGLRSISYIAVGTYHKSNADRSAGLSATLEELSGTVVHELRNSLSLVLTGLDVFRLAKDQDEESRCRQIDIMSNAVERGDYLLDTLRVVTLSESARTHDDLMDLADGIDKVLGELQDVAEPANVEIRVGEIPDVRAEAILLYIFLINTISNALKYRDEGKSERWVEITAEFKPEQHDSGFCEITVRDNGLGVPEELASRVFQKGFRGHPDRAQGAGLGLYLAHQALTSRGGTIVMHSESGAGTSVKARIRCLSSVGNA